MPSKPVLSLLHRTFTPTLLPSFHHIPHLQPASVYRLLHTTLGFHTLEDSLTIDIPPTLEITQANRKKNEKEALKKQRERDVGIKKLQFNTHFKRKPGYRGSGEDYNRNRNKKVAKDTKSSDMSTMSWARVAGGGKEGGKSTVPQEQTQNAQTTSLQSHDHHPERSSHPQQQQQAHEPRGPYKAEDYQRPTAQTPQTARPEEEDHYVITLATSTPLHDQLTRLRTLYFPAHLNHLAAHIALFRALPGSQLPLIKHHLAATCSKFPAFDIATEKKPFRMRMGVGVNVGEGKAEAVKLYRRLRDEWAGFLSEQDRGCVPHWTVQNKQSDGGKVERCFEGVGRELEGGGLAGLAVGCELWLYDRGFWRFVERFEFGGQRREAV